ncbi:MAG: nucleoside hydrolase [Pirellulales bacterium]|nr:nucleoside hydrolase [Pirellulales bacterium]
MWQLTLLALLAPWCFVMPSASPAAEPVRVIFDTDMGNDIDDALALGVLHALASRAECQIEAVTISKDNRFAAPYVDLVNTFYGRPEIPIGVVREGATPEDSAYTRDTVLASDAGRPRWPRRLSPDAPAPAALELLRRTLAAAPDRSLVPIVVGFSTNFARLLDSPADEHSPLTGVELCRQKCRRLVMMAGMFSLVGRHKEYNVFVDLPAAKRVFADWPTEIVVSGFEVGQAIKFPASSIERDFNYVAHHPLKEAYVLYQRMPYDRETWDLTAALVAVRPEHGYFQLSPPGTITVDDQMVTRFAESPAGKHRHLMVDGLGVARVREALIQLASQPPCLLQATADK